MFAVRAFDVSRPLLADVARDFQRALFSPLRQRRGRVVEIRVAAAIVKTRLRLLTAVQRFDTPGIALDVLQLRSCTHGLAKGGLQAVRPATGRHAQPTAVAQRALAARIFGHDGGVLTELVARVATHQGVGRVRVLVLDIAAANLGALAHADLAVHAVHPEIFAAGLDFVSHPQRLGVAVGIDRRQRLGQQNAPRKRLKAVIAIALQGLDRQNDGGLVAVAGDDFHLFRAGHGIVFGDRKGARDTLPRKLLDQLHQAVPGHKGIQQHAVLIVMATRTVHRAAVVTKIAFANAGNAAATDRVAKAVPRVEVAPQQVRLFFVDAHIHLRGRLRVKALDRCVAVHGVIVILADGTEQPLIRLLVGVVGHGQQRIALDFSLQEKRGAQSAVALAVFAAAGKVANFLLKAIVSARARQLQRRLAIKTDDALDQTHRQHLPQFRHKAHHALCPCPARADAHGHVLRLGWRQQQHLRLAVHHLDLHATGGAVAVSAAGPEFIGGGTWNLDASGRCLDRDQGFTLHRLAVEIEHADGQPRRRLAVGWQTVLRHHDPNQADLAVDRVIDIAYLGG